MTSEQRFERQLPAILEELYLGRTPDYRNEVLANAIRTRQRPRWTFPGRWLPMADIASQPVIAPRLPWRMLAVTLLILALLLATAVALVGSRQPKVPPPFGVAGSGLITYSVYGDIYTADPVIGTTTAIVTGPEADSGPVFSRDGTRLAFLRDTDQIGTYDLMVSNADGSNVRVVPGSPIHGMDLATRPDFEWASDSQSLIVYSEPQILRLDALGSAPAVVISDDAVPTGRLGPDGLIPYQPRSVAEDALWVVGLDGSAPRELLRLKGANGSLGEVQFSPDGTMLAFVQGLPGNEWRIHVANADGTGVHRLTDATGAGNEAGFAWSPDSRSIAFNRWAPADPARLDGDWNYERLGVATVGDGAAGSRVRALGPGGFSSGLLFDWAPDGSTILAMAARPEQGTVLYPPLIIDVASGDGHELDLTSNSMPTWQRVVP